MTVKKFQINEIESVRIDVFLSEQLNLTRSHIKKLCDDGNVKCGEKPVKASKIVKKGDKIEVLLPENKNLDIEPKNMPLNIVYQDQDVAVIDKPQGLTVHAGSGTQGDTLVNALLYHLDNLSGINGVIRPGIVHRIDKNTSGLLVIAKNDKAHLSLAKQLEDKTCHRIYLALLEGVVKDYNGTIRTFIDRSQKDRTKMAVSKTGREAITDFKVIKRYAQHTLCEFSLRTGRTHQIRVHAKHIGHPIVGDREYGYKNQKFNLEGQLLHAYKLEFIHPTTNELVSFVSDLPAYFQKILKSLR